MANKNCWDCPIRPPYYRIVTCEYAKISSQRGYITDCNRRPRLGSWEEVHLNRVKYGNSNWNGKKMPRKGKN